MLTNSCWQYNETIHDLLAPVDKNDLKNDAWGQDKKGEQKEKHSIKHDPRTGQTHVTGAQAICVSPWVPSC